MEYSTISMLNYCIDTLAYVGLPEVLLEWGLDDVTLIFKKIVELDLDLIKKNN